MAKRFNPRDNADLQAFVRSVEWSRRSLRPFREKRREAIRQFVGFNYSEDGAGDKVPVNSLELAISIYKRHLVSSQPQVLVTTNHGRLKGDAHKLGLATNHILEEIDFGESLQRYVQDAIFSMGIMKVGLTSDLAAESEGFRHDAGQPFADNVDLDDWVHDMGVKRWDQIGYCGNRYRVPLWYVQESNLFKNTDDIQPDSESRYTNEDGSQRVEVISRGEYGVVEDHDPTVELWDFWLPREQLIITLDASENGGPSGRKPLRIVEWDGQEIGPYHRLSYLDVPNNVMPLPPVALWMDLHTLGNTIFNKLARQAVRQKTVTGYRGSSASDAERLRDEDDGGMFRMDDPSGVNQFSSGGIDQASLAFFLQIRDLFNYLGGNLDTLGGLASGADTLGQEEILSNRASQRLLDMQDRTQTSVQTIVESIADYVWNDPTLDLTLSDMVGGPDGIVIPIRITSELKEGDLIDMNVTIEPFSMTHRGPAEKLQTITQVFERFIIPNAAMLQAQNLAPDMKALLDIVAKYSNTPEIRDILIEVEGQPSQGEEATGGGNGNSTTTNIRRNIPGSTRQGRDDVMQKILLGSGTQESETASLSSPRN